jgi:hypothetical protein
MTNDLQDSTTFDKPEPFGVVLDRLLIAFADVALFAPAATDLERKEAIMAAYARHDITPRQTEMLIEAFGLAAA